MNNNPKVLLMKSLKPFWNALPVLVGIIFLMGIVDSFFQKSLYVNIFNQNQLVDIFVADTMGSIFAGNPITSYVLAGEFMSQGISLVVATTFLVAWVTVGVVQFPAEAMLLGKKFAFWRNFLSFIFSIFVALVTVAVLNIL